MMSKRKWAVEVAETTGKWGGTASFSFKLMPSASQSEKLDIRESEAIL
jgi:hypothetical protein